MRIDDTHTIEECTLQNAKDLSFNITMAFLFQFKTPLVVVINVVDCVVRRIEALDNCYVSKCIVTKQNVQKYMHMLMWSFVTDCQLFISI